MAADEGGAGLEVRVAVLEAQVSGLMTTVLTRLLDTALPAYQPVAAAPEPGESDGGDDGGYDLPVTADWTDPFIGLDAARDYRAVGRLEAGELPPYLPAPDAPPGSNGAASVGEAGALDRWRELGEGAFEEWNRATHQPDVGHGDVVGGWVAPIDLGDGERVE